MGGLNLFAYAPNPTGWIDPLGLTKKPGAIGFLQGPNIPGGVQEGLSKHAGGSGIDNPAVEEVYNSVPKDIRSGSHGACAEADALSKAANKAGVLTVNQLKELTEGASSIVHDKLTGANKTACSSCAYVQNMLRVTDACTGK